MAKSPQTVKLVTTEGCANCKQAAQTLKNALTETLPAVTIEEIDMISDEGQQLVKKHGITASPGVVMNGHLLVSGKVKKQEVIENVNAVLDNE
jgi:glutaredoxin